jgi:hypothetical protein
MNVLMVGDIVGPDAVDYLPSPFRDCAGTETWTS